MKLRIEAKDLDDAVNQNLLSAEQKDAFWEFLKARNKNSSQALTVLAYFGAFIVISSMTWFATRAFSESNPWMLAITGVVYFVLFLVLGAVLRDRLTSEVPSMLCLTAAAFLVPLAIYGIQRLTGLSALEFPGSYHDYYVWINGGWFAMELGTIVASIALLWLFGYELLTLPLAFTLWFLSMDVTPLLFGKTFEWEQLKNVSLVFGLVMLVVSYGLDLTRKTRDYSFWLYLFGLMIFWSSVSFSSTDSLVLKFLYCGMNVLLVFIALLFRRIVFLVFGALGVFLFLFDLSNNVFRESLWFPLYLSLVGALILAASIALFRLQGKIDGFLAERVPESVKRFIPRNL